MLHRLFIPLATALLLLLSSHAVAARKVLLITNGTNVPVRFKVVEAIDFTPADNPVLAEGELDVNQSGYFLVNSSCSSPQISYLVLRQDMSYVNPWITGWASGDSLTLR